MVEFLQTRQSTFKISCQIAVICDTDTQQNVILNMFLKIIIPLAEINQAVGDLCQLQEIWDLGKGLVENSVVCRPQEI